MIRRDLSGGAGASAIPEVSQLASVASVGFNPLFPIAVLFFIVVLPVFAVLLFFFPPVFPAIASALSVIPEPLEFPAVQDTEVLNTVATAANSGEAVVESGRVGLDEAVVESGRVGSVEAVVESGQVGLDEEVVESGQVGSVEAVVESGQVGSVEAVVESGQVGSVEAVVESGQVGSVEAAKDSDRVESKKAAKDSDRVASNEPADEPRRDRLESEGQRHKPRKVVESAGHWQRTGHVSADGTGQFHSSWRPIGRNFVSSLFSRRAVGWPAY